MPKIVQVTTVHRPFDIRIFHKECKTLAEAGYEVVLIATHERAEQVDDIRVIGLPKVTGRLQRVLLQAWRAYRAARSERPATYHLHDPELIPVGLILKALGHRVVYDVHEDLPRQILSKRWIPRVARYPLAWLSAAFEYVGGQTFDGIVAATPRIARRFPSRSTVLVRNFPLLGELRLAPDLAYANRPPHALYVGGMDSTRGLYEMVDAIRLIAPELGARLRLAGEITPRDRENLEGQPGWRHVDALGWLSRVDIMTEFTRARVGLVMLHPLQNFVESLPIKLFEYMAAGIPVIASDFPVWRSIIEAAGCGLTVDPLKPEAIACAVQWLLEHPLEAEEMGRRGSHAAQERYNWSTEGTKLVRYYEDLLIEQ